MPNVKEFYGLCFSVSNWPVEKSAYLPYLRKVASHTEWVRTYNNNMPDFGLEAHKLGLKVAAGAVILEREHDKNRVEIERLLRECILGHVDLAIIGNESIYAGSDITPDMHISYLRDFKRRCPNVPVTTAQDALRLLEHPEVIEACDIVAMHTYPFWGGIHVNDAYKDVAKMYQQVVKIAHGKEVQILETGWPTKGNTIQDAVPSLENMFRFWSSVLQWARANGVKVWVFEALDEPWKTAMENEQGAHWGLWTRDGTRKVAAA